MSEAVNIMPAPAAAGSAAPGRRLAAARQAQNLTPAEVARQLKLSVWQVDALEAGHYQQLPGPIFVRGFIRNYARLVKLDPGELLRAGGDSLPQPVARPEAPPSQDIPFPTRDAPRWPIYAAAVGVIVGALAIYEFFWNEPEATIARPAAVAPTSASAPSKVVGASVSTPSVGEAQPVQAAPAAVAPKAPVSVPPVAGVSQTDAERPPRPGERQVRLNFDDESWVEIRDRNERVIFSQLNRPGTQQLIQGLPPFSIVVGNAQGVRLTYDERPVDLAPHIKIDVARLILQ